MSCIRPATPGLIVTLGATVLLVVVSFSVPLFKSVYFLKASISVSGTNGTITFGTLGYCIELANGTSCSKPSIGYQLDVNGLVGNSLPVEIPQVAVKWLTDALFLHVVALVLAAIATLFGLLAHVREFAMTCFSTCIASLAATVAFFAFVFDIALFYVAKARINAVGSAQMGSAVWITLAAWLLLFFSGCFYSTGHCCVSRRRANKVRNHELSTELANRRKEEMGLPPLSGMTGTVDNAVVRLDREPLADQNVRYRNGYAPLGSASPSATLPYDGGGYMPVASSHQDSPRTSSAPPQALSGHNTARDTYHGGYLPVADTSHLRPEMVPYGRTYPPAGYNYENVTDGPVAWASNTGPQHPDLSYAQPQVGDYLRTDQSYPSYSPHSAFAGGYSHSVFPPPSPQPTPFHDRTDLPSGLPPSYHPMQPGGHVYEANHPWQ